MGTKPPAITRLESSLTNGRHSPLADNIIYATAQKFDASVWTQGCDFERLEGVKYFPKNKHT